MIDLPPAHVPELSEEWIVSHEAALVHELCHRGTKRLRRIGLVGAAGVAAAVSALVLAIGGGEQYAFAGWSASPTNPSSSQLSSADAVCQARLAQAQQLAPSNKGPGPNSASFLPELSDVRGPYTVTVFGNGTKNAVLCVSTPDSTGLRWLVPAIAPVGAGTIAVGQVSVLARDSQPYTLVEGRTGVGVNGVTLALGNGTSVTATTGDGLFIAWWPGSQTIASATVSTATGVSSQTLNVPGPLIPPSPKPKPARPETQSSCMASAAVGCGDT